MPSVSDSQDHKHSSIMTFRFSGLLKKELREILRDRRTIITLILMPVLVYPLLGLMLQKFFISQMANLGQIEYHIILPTETEGKLFEKVFNHGEQLLLLKEYKEFLNSEKSKPEETLNEFKQQQPKVKILVVDQENKKQSIESLVRTGAVDAGVRFFPSQDQKKNSPDNELGGRFEIIYGSQSRHSRLAASYVEKRLQSVRWKYKNQQLKKLGESDSGPFTTSVSAVTSESVEAFSLVTIVPLILILMTVTGAVYPAIDLTAGERERGTLETLMAAPLPRMWILSAKFIAVLFVAILTALVNMSAMLATAYANGLETVLFGTGMTPFVLMEILLLLVIFAAFFSAVLLCLTSFARSFKEAQAYLIPLMLISMAPGILGMVPDLKMTPMWAVIPLANIVLLSRDFLLHESQPALVFLSVISTLFYGAVALSLAARIFGADTILYQSHTSWAALLKRSEKKHLVPTLSNAMICLAVLFPVFILSTSIVGRLGEMSMSQRLLVSGTLTFSLFLLIPLLFARMGGVKLKTGFRWSTPGILACLGAILLGFTLWPFAYEIEILSLSDERIESFSKLFESLKLELGSVPLWVKLISLAVLPAVCEELFFRGYLLSSLLDRFSNTPAILISSFLFALFHVIVRDSLFIERFFPSFLMGLSLGYVNVLSRSVIPGIMLHMIHNGLLISIANFQNLFSKWEVNLKDQKHLPMVWLGGSLLLVCAGFYLLYLNQRNQVDSTMKKV